MFSLPLIRTQNQDGGMERNASSTNLLKRSLLSTATPKLFTEPPSPAQQEDPLVVQELHRQGYTKFLCF